MNKIEAVDRRDLFKWTKDRLKEYKDGLLLCCEIKKYVPLKTNKQLGLLFKAIEYFIQAQGGFMSRHIDEREKKIVYLGLVEKYGQQEPTGFSVLSDLLECPHCHKMIQEDIEQFVSIPLSEVNRLDQFEDIFNGLFIEAWGQTPSIDMGGFITKWNKIKDEEREKELKEAGDGCPE